jgi:hypothetical protein
MRGVVNVLGFAQALLGGVGFAGIACYFAEPATNNSRHQLLFVPVWRFIYAVPLLIVSALVYRRFRTRMSRLGRWIFNTGCLLPIVALAIAVAQ